MTKNQLSPKAQVSKHIQSLPESIRAEIEYLRQLMLGISPEIEEHIKWNSPAFFYSGEMKPSDPREYKRDILVMNLRNQKIMCVLPTGMRISKNTELLEGNYTDGRRMIYFKDMEDLQSKEEKLKACILEWLEGVEK